MLSSRTWRFLVVLSSATARLVSPAHAAEAAVSFSEPAGVSHEERASAEPFGRATEKVLMLRFYRAGSRLRNGFARRITPWRTATRTCRIVRGRRSYFSPSFLKPVRTEGYPALEFSIEPINTAIRPTSDCCKWGVPDRWSTPPAGYSAR
jgi:predicted transglutaminase-like cysteine proteinase